MVSAFTIAAAPNRQRKGGNLLSLHDGLHRMPISAAKASVRGDWLVTGCLDSTIRVWQLASDKLHYQAVLSGHYRYPITYIDLCTEFSLIVSGSEEGRVLVWTCARLVLSDTYRRPKITQSAVCLSIAKMVIFWVSPGLNWCLPPLMAKFSANENHSRALRLTR